LWSEIIENALPVVDFYLQVVSAQYDLTTAKGKSALVREVLPLLREIGDQVERTHYVGQLARLVKIDERVLLAELGEGRRPSPSPRPSPVPSPVEAPSAAEGEKRVFGLEEYSLAIILGQLDALVAANEELVSLDLPPLSADDFYHAENRQLFLTLSDWATRTRSRSPQGGQGEDASQIEHLINQCDPVLGSHLNFLREQWDALPAAPSEILIKDLVGRILLMRDQHLQEEIANLRFLQDEAEENHNEEQRLHYQTLANTAKEKLRLIHYAIDRRSIMGRRRAEAERLGLVSI